MIVGSRILLVEDDRRLHPFVEAVLGGRHVSLVSVCTAREALQAFTHSPPSLVLLDLGLPDLDGVELLGLMRAQHADVPIVVLTVASSEARILAAIRAGASGYLLKEDIATRLVPAVIDALEGGVPMSPIAARFVVARVRDARPTPSTPESGLTLRERDVLEGIARGLTYDEVGTALGVSANTIRTHIRSIYEKLDASTKGEAVAAAMRRGLLD